LAPVPSGTRPLADRAREGLFSSLGGAVEGARVLDLFAGTGAMGIEALSRGAASALFVDRAHGSVRAVRENLRRTHLEAAAELRRLDATQAVRRPFGRFDLVLLDPPYGTEPAALDDLLRNIAGQGLCAPGALVVLTRGRKSYTPVIPLHWRSITRLAYGDAVILVFQTP
jgi:16S rRNA (guanine966-N2)-methyltransferase